MTKRKPPKPTCIPPRLTLEQVAEIKRERQLLQTAALIAALDAAHDGDLTRAQLATIARHLTDNNPGLIPEGPMTPHLRAIVRMFADDNPPGAPNSETIALAADLLTVGSNRVAVPEAHRRLADVTGKTVEAIRKDRSRANKQKPLTARRLIISNGPPPGVIGLPKKV